MNKNDDPTSDALKDAWIESLVRSASVEEDHEARISYAMRKLEDQNVVLAFSRPKQQWIRVGSLVLAAILLIFVIPPLLLSEGGAKVARAAIDRSLHLASQSAPLKYIARVELKLSANRSSTVEGSLVVQGDDRFLMERPALLPGASLRIGRLGDEFWVLPAVGPVLVGDQASIAHWLHEQEATDGRLLHIDFLLNRMKSRQYRLTVEDDESVTMPDGKTFWCQRVSAVRSSAGSTVSPDRIELWASRDSGMAVLLLASWELSEKQTGRRSLRLTFQSEQPGLTQDWFRPEAHYKGTRQTIRLDSSGD